MTLSITVTTIETMISDEADEVIKKLFDSNQENLYMIHHDSSLFYDIYNTITEHNRRQTYYL